MQVRIYVILIIGLTFVSCNEDSKTEKEIAKIEVDFTVERFDTAFLQATPKDLPKLTPDRKAIPGTAAGTVRLKQRMVALATESMSA